MSLRDVSFLTLGIGIAVIAFIAFYYISSPKPEIIYEKADPTQPLLSIISFTEYYANETGQVIVRISDYKGNPLSGSCNTTIVFPNKTLWYVDYPMSPSSVSGTYYTNLVIPDVLGVYEYYFDCNTTLQGNSFSVRKASSFHVSIAYQKFQEILDKLDQINTTVGNITFNDTMIMDKLYKIQDEIASVNNTVKSMNGSISIQFTNLGINIQTKYDNLMTAILNLQQKWLDMANNIIKDLGFTGQSLNKIGDTIGITSSSGCGIFDQLAGRC